MSAKTSLSVIAIMTLLAGCLSTERPDREYWVLEVSSDVRQEPAAEARALCGVYGWGPAAGVDHANQRVIVPAGRHDIDWSRTWVVILHRSLDVVDDATNCDRDWRMFAAETAFDWTWRDGIVHRVAPSQHGVLLDGELVGNQQTVRRSVDGHDSRREQADRIVGDLTFSVHGPWRMQAILEYAGGGAMSAVGRTPALEGANHTGDWVTSL